jgi:hypothetical protein
MTPEAARLFLRPRFAMKTTANHHVLFPVELMGGPHGHHALRIVDGVNASEQEALSKEVLPAEVIEKWSPAFRSLARTSHVKRLGPHGQVVPQLVVEANASADGIATIATQR